MKLSLLADTPQTHYLMELISFLDIDVEIKTFKSLKALSREPLKS